MPVSGVLAVGQIVFVNIPGKGPHPAVVVLGLRDGYILVNGTGTPEQEPPVVEMSEPAARRIGLTKTTMFYGAPKFVWYWRPAGTCHPCGDMATFPSHLRTVRKAAMDVLNGFKNPMQEVQKLPEEVGISLADLALLRAAMAAAASPTTGEP